MKIKKYQGEFDNQISTLLEAMQYKLGVHADKGPWTEVPLPRLLEVLQDEVNELIASCANSDVLEGVHECGDVAICVMMIAEVLMRSRTLTPSVIMESASSTTLGDAVNRARGGPAPPADKKGYA